MRTNDGLTELLSYAATGLKVRPDVADYDAGVVAGQDLPEAWWNYLLNVITSNSDITKDRLANILTELSTILASSGLTPNGAGAATQVDEALKIKYMSRLGIVVTDFNAIVTTSLPQGSVTAFYADTGFTNGPAGATRFTGFIARAKVAADDALVIAFGNVTAVGSSNYPIAFRLRVAGVWTAWSSVLGSNNSTSAATGSTVMTRDANGRTKVAAPSASDDVATKDTVDTHAALTAPHSATSAATASRLMLRDASGRAKVVAPAAVDDIARLDTVTGNVATHAGLTAAGTHGSAVAATVNTLVHRDAAGRAQIAAPSAAGDIVNKGTLDSHTEATAAGTHGSTVAATANRLIHRDASGRAQIAAPSADADIANKGWVYPVNSYYVQYPAANSSTDATEFPASERPASLFGGTWAEQWSTESIYFRTRGTLSDTGRTDGKQLDQMQRITGESRWRSDSFGIAATTGEQIGAFVDGTVGNTVTGTSVAGKSLKFDSAFSPDARTSSTTAGETRVTNRRIKIWKRTA